VSFGKQRRKEYKRAPLHIRDASQPRNLPCVTSANSEVESFTLIIGVLHLHYVPLPPCLPPPSPLTFSTRPTDLRNEMELTEDTEGQSLSDLAYSNRWRVLNSIHDQVGPTQPAFEIKTDKQMLELFQREDDESRDEANRMAMDALAIPDLPLAMRVQSHIVLACSTQGAYVWHAEQAVSTMERAMADASYGQAEQTLLAGARRTLSEVLQFQKDNQDSESDEDDEAEGVEEGSELSEEEESIEDTVEKGSKEGSEGEMGEETVPAKAELVGGDIEEEVERAAGEDIGEAPAEKKDTKGKRKAEEVEQGGATGEKKVKRMSCLDSGKAFEAPTEEEIKKRRSKPT